MCDQQSDGEFADEFYEYQSSSEDMASDAWDDAATERRTRLAKTTSQPDRFPTAAAKQQVLEIYAEARARYESVIEFALSI